MRRRIRRIRRLRCSRVRTRPRRGSSPVPKPYKDISACVPKGLQRSFQSLQRSEYLAHEPFPFTHIHTHARTHAKLYSSRMPPQPRPRSNRSRNTHYAARSTRESLRGGYRHLKWTHSQASHSSAHALTSTVRTKRKTYKPHERSSSTTYARQSVVRCTYACFATEVRPCRQRRRPCP